jgi:hypothetical protein
MAEGYTPSRAAMQPRGWKRQESDIENILYADNQMTCSGTGCRNESRIGQRYCRECHAKAQRKYRQKLLKQAGRALTVPRETNASW